MHRSDLANNLSLLKCGVHIPLHASSAATARRQLCSKETILSPPTHQTEPSCAPFPTPARAGSLDTTLP